MSAESSKLHNIRTRTLKAPSHIMKRISSLSDSGVDFSVASVRIPHESEFNTNARLVAAFSGVADEGELGTMVRTATALGFGHIMLLEKCADVFGVKATRASQGALWTTSFSVGSTAQLLSFARQHNYLPIQPCRLNCETKTMDHLSFDSKRYGGLIALICPYYKKGFTEISVGDFLTPWTVASSCFLHSVRVAS